MAVEVDLPVLQILGAGATVPAVVHGVMPKIPPAILDWGKLVDDDGSSVDGVAKTEDTDIERIELAENHTVACSEHTEPMTYGHCRRHPGQTTRLPH
jgi:hypothetical protein